MGIDKAVDSTMLDAGLAKIADAIRDKTGKSATMTMGEMPREIAGIETVQEPYIAETYDDSGNLIAAKMVGQPKVRTNLFSGCKYLATVKFSQKAKSIDKNAITMSKVAEISIPSSVKSIVSQAFVQCAQLKTVTFLGTPDEIGSSAFVQCGITTINAPWEEGAVANAPWGATNATINYNYTKEG